MTKHQCSCGKIVMLTDYCMHLEGSLTFRDYTKICPNCGREIKTRDLDEEDLTEPEYLC